MVKKILSKLKSNRLTKWMLSILPCATYIKALKKLPLDEKAILLEYQHGSEISGNIFYILKTLISRASLSMMLIFRL